MDIRARSRHIAGSKRGSIRDSLPCVLSTEMVIDTRGVVSQLSTFPFRFKEKVVLKSDGCGFHNTPGTTGAWSWRWVLQRWSGRAPEWTDEIWEIGSDSIVAC